MSRPLALALAVALALPAAARADDWDDGYRDGYDVSVDLNVQGGAVGVDAFQAPLQPYGDWVVVGSYGRVWRPRVAAGWRPYYNGRWEWTNEGWFWASDEPWGWAAYHYGRWAYDPYYGWVWVPGSEWAPAWVSWRVSGDAVGWAPLAPGFSAYVTTYPFVDFWWTFVPAGRFCSMPVHSVAYAPGYARRWYDATAPAPAYVSRPGPPVRGAGVAPAWGGPAPRMIEQHLGRPLAPVRVVGVGTPGARARPGEIAVYRPERGFQGRPMDHGAPGFVGRPGDRGVPGGGRPAEGAPVRTGPAAPGFAGRPPDHGAQAPGLVGRGQAPAGFAPGARAPEYRGGPAPGRPPEYRVPDAPRGAPPARGGFGGVPGSAPGNGRTWAPSGGGAPSGGNHGAWSAPGGGAPSGGNHGAWTPPAGGGGHEGGAPQRGAGHARGERH